MTKFDVNVEGTALKKIPELLEKQNELIDKQNRLLEEKNIILVKLVETVKWLK